MSFETVRQRLVNNVRPDFDVTEHSFLGVVLNATALELADSYSLLEDVFNLSFVDTSFGIHLTELCAKHGVIRKLDEKTILNVLVKRNNELADLPIGSLIQNNRHQFEVLYKHTTGKFLVRSVETGFLHIGDNFTGPDATYDIKLDLTNLEGVQFGTSYESDEDLRKRFKQTMKQPPSNGNVGSYKHYLSERGFLSRVRCSYPQPGSVTVYVTNSDFEPIDTTQKVILQQQICPGTSSNRVYGIAPVGATARIEPMELETVQVTFTLQLEEGLTQEVLPTHKAISDYFERLVREFYEEDTTTIRISHITDTLLSLEGVVDVSEVKINGVAKNYKLEPNKLPVLGEIV